MSEGEDKQTSLDAFSGQAPRKLNLPSEETTIPAANNQGSTTYHDLGKLYPNAPVPKVADGLVIHRATLHDLTGVLQLMDWVADGEAAIVRMEKLLNRKLELQTAIERLNKFVEADLGGQIIRLTETRLMLLPPGCRGVRGVESEAFASDSSDFD
jgi:SepF-like predicted cell division protein (DUF552 family)